MTFIGMDPDAVRRAAEGLALQAEQLRSLVDLVDGGVQNMAHAWPGPDSDLFQSDWGSAHRANLLHAAEETRARADWLRAQIDAQLVVSDMGATSYGPLGDCRAPATLTPGSLLDMSRGAYGNGDSTGAWREATDAELKKLGIDRSMLHDDRTGFDAVIYIGDDGQYVVAYRGSSPLGEILRDSRDWVNNAHGALDLSAQTEQAVRLALAMETAVGEGNLTFTGHSLGGRLAAVSSIATGSTAVTFDAAGVSTAEMMYAKVAGGGEVGFHQYLGGLLPVTPDAWDNEIVGVDESNIHNYRGLFDPVSNGQLLLDGLPEAIGQQHVAPVAPTGDLGADHDFPVIEDWVDRQDMPRRN